MTCHLFLGTGPGWQRAASRLSDWNLPHLNVDCPWLVWDARTKRFSHSP
jgi:hypothetical protein